MASLFVAAAGVLYASGRALPPEGVSTWSLGAVVLLLGYEAVVSEGHSPHERPHRHPT
jgi:hypothetical protein